MRNDSQHEIKQNSSRDYTNDRQLLEGLLQGQEEAWRYLHDTYDRLIYRCITKVTQRFGEVLSSEDVQEVYANFFVQLLSNDMRKLRGFDPNRGTRLSTWIGMLAIKATYDHLRAIRREAAQPSSQDAEQLISSVESPFDALENKQRREILHRLVAELSEKDRQFVELYFDLGLPPQEIADRLNITIKTVYSKKHKIRSRLEQAVQRGLMAA